MTVWRTNTRAAQKPKAHMAICINCPVSDPPHVEQNHHTRDGHCAFIGCQCNVFRSKDWRKDDGEIRKKNRGMHWDSRHERLSITDIERSMLRGETDIVELKRQMPFELGVRAGRDSVYIADAVAILREGGKFTHRIYEPKGLKSPMYVLKRRLVQILYPHVEFVEISQ